MLLRLNNYEYNGALLMIYSQLSAMHLVSASDLSAPAAQVMSKQLLSHFPGRSSKLPAGIFAFERYMVCMLRGGPGGGRKDKDDDKPKRNFIAKLFDKVWPPRRERARTHPPPQEEQEYGNVYDVPASLEALRANNGSVRPTRAENQRNSNLTVLSSNASGSSPAPTRRSSSHSRPPRDDPLQLLPPSRFPTASLFASPNAAAGPSAATFAGPSAATFAGPSAATFAGLSAVGATPLRRSSSRNSLHGLGGASVSALQMPVGAVPQPVAHLQVAATLGPDASPFYNGPVYVQLEEFQRQRPNLLQHPVDRLRPGVVVTLLHPIPRRFLLHGLAEATIGGFRGYVTDDSSNESYFHEHLNPNLQRAYYCRFFYLGTVLLN